MKLLATAPTRLALLLMVTGGIALAAPLELLSATNGPPITKPDSAGFNTAKPPLFVGLRRSSYGLRKRNADDPWWCNRAKAFAANFPGSQPLIRNRPAEPSYAEG